LIVGTRPREALAVSQAQHRTEKKLRQDRGLPATVKRISKKRSEILTVETRPQTTTPKRLREKRAKLLLRARKLLAEVEERELRLAVKKREYVALAKVQESWTRNVAEAMDLLRHKFELELPPVLSGLDAVAIQVECGKALDEVFTILHTSGAGVG
jgi:hypothetical protein